MDTGPAVAGPINLGNPSEVTVRELAELIIDLSGSASEIISQPLPADDPKQRQPDIAKARAQLGWQPTIALRDGLLPTLEYFRRFLQ
jgi:UDP-glucuronate decarboxylase